MIEVLYEWDDIKILVPVPSCIACINCGAVSIDENDCVCLSENKHHTLTDKCESFRLDVARQNLS